LKAKTTCFRCDKVIEKAANFCPFCGFYNIKDFVEKEVLIIRMDISNFTALASRTEVFELKNALSTVFLYLKDLIELKGGYLNTYIGDEVESIWGLSIKPHFSQILEFLKEAHQFFSKGEAPLGMRVKTVIGAGKALFYPTKTEGRSYLLVFGKFISDLDMIKYFVKPLDPVGIGNIEKFIPENFIEPIDLEDIKCYRIKYERLNT
jgi:RNA polymerase subunit RPABC4/transcription elongation factor Spt4